MQHTVTLLIGMLAACALAAPMPERILTKRIGSFKASARGRQHLNRDPRREMARAYRKYGWDIILVDSSTSQTSDPYAATGATSDVAETTPSASSDYAAETQAAGDGTGEVTASPEQNESEYLSPVSIGGQTLMLDFDTGSADLWVFSTDLPSDEIDGHTAFDPSKSSTFSEYQGGSWRISYGDGSGASGSVGYDQVKIGDLTVQKQAVELATQVSSSFVSDENNDGLVGLAFSSINTVQPQPQRTFFENIMNDLDQPLFTADLEDNAAGTYEFGTIDTSKYTGDLKFTTIDNSEGFWMFDSRTYTVAGKKYTNSVGSSAIADTGTSLILVDDEVAQAYYSQISGAQMSSTAGGYVYPCDAEIPAFGVQIGNSGFTAEISGADITFAQVDSQTCFGGVQSNGGAGFQILGDVLLKQYFAVFDGGNLSFGLAPKSTGVNTK